MIEKPSSGSGNIGHAGNKNGGSAEDDNWNTDLNVNNGSDNGSDTQVWINFLTKHAISHTTNLSKSLLHIYIYL